MKTFIAMLATLLVLAAPVAKAQDAAEAQRKAIFERALAQVERGLSAAPEAPQLRLLKGQFLARLGRTHEAVEILQKLAADHPELSELRITLARLSEGVGRL